MKRRKEEEEAILHRKSNHFCKLRRLICSRHLMHQTNAQVEKWEGGGELTSVSFQSYHLIENLAADIPKPLCVI